MNPRRLILFFLLSFLFSGGFVQARSNTAFSKDDGSLWIATDGQGLLRVGRLGHRLQYTRADGRIPNDTIVSVLSDSKGVIWIQDIAGNLLSYSSSKGFKKESLPPVTSLSYDGEKLWASTDSELYSWIPGEKPAAVVALPTSVTEMLFSPDGALWVLGKGALCRLEKDGKFSEWELGQGVSNLLPFNFEIETTSPADGGESGISLWLCILIALVFFAFGILLARIFSRPPKPEPALFEPKPVVIEQKPVEPKPAVIEQKPVEPKPVEPKPSIIEEKPFSDLAPSPQSSAFYKEVYSLCEKHLDDPDFDVEKIAALTGISRIHVNRKLKAEADVSPSAMIKQLRMEKAAALIEQRQLSLSEIALACGFSTSSYFSTAFRSYYGVSPSDYLNKVSKSK
ncbi:MAG: helix-turn-helix domain-containing protein [Bacteroidales bacterium]|nr:helix-turn-helix domain-containing protein [Bacteroidales bacterium]